MRVFGNNHIHVSVCKVVHICVQMKHTRMLTC